MAAPTDSLYPPLTAALIKRSEEPVAVAPPFPRKSEFAQNAKLFAVTWAGGFVFFMTFLG